MDERYINVPLQALTPLLIPNGPGKFPSSVKIAAGQLFALDGDEPINVEMLLRTKAIRACEPGETDTFGAQKKTQKRRGFRRLREG